jgi:hypothetical protein
MILGLHGRLRSGKDTVCEMIAEHHTGKVVRKAFADPLKLSAVRCFKPDATLDEALAICNKLKVDGYVDAAIDIGEGFHVTGRQFLQNYGTEAHRSVFGDNFWVDVSLPRWDGMGHTESGIFGIDPLEDFVVFTDVRFPNEAERIKEWGGEIWEIQRPSLNSGDTHASEVRLPDSLIDVIIHNAGTLDELSEAVQSSLRIQKALKHGNFRN